MSKAKSTGKLSSAERRQQWLVRMPGGPLRLIRSNRELTESRVKDIYLSQLKFRRSMTLDDPDTVWPFLKLTTDDEVTKNHSWLLQESLRKNHRGVIEVVDGEVIHDDKPPVERKRVATRVETTAG